MSGLGFRRIFALIASLALVLGGLVQPAAAQGQTYTSALTGSVITYNAPYAYQDDNSYSDAMMEFAIFTGEADLAGIGFMPAGLDLNSMRDAFLEGLFGDMTAAHQIDRGDYSGVSYSLDMLQLDGYEMAVFTLFLSNRDHGYSEFQVYLAPPSLFTPLLQSAQTNISINGAPFLDGIDAVVMGQMVTANIGVTGGATTTNVSEVQGDAPAPTEAVEAAPTEAPVTGEVDPTAYLAELVRHRGELHASIDRFNTAISGLSADSTQEEANAAFDVVTAEAAVWQTYNDTALAVTAPSGYEGVHASYLTWADEVTTMGNLWMDLVGGGTTTTDQFFAQLDIVAAQDAQLGTDISDALLATDEGPAEPTVVATETEVVEETADPTPSRTRRDAQSSDPTPDPTETEAVEETADPTPARTRRDAQSSDPTPEPSETEEADNTGTTRDPRSLTKTAADAQEESNTSETSSKAGVREGSQRGSRDRSTETSTASGSWVDPDSGAEVQWPAGLQQVDSPADRPGQLILQGDTGGIVTLMVIQSSTNSPDDTIGSLSETVEGQPGVEYYFGDTAELVWSEVDPQVSAALVRVENADGEYEWLYVQMTCIDTDCENLVYMIARGDADSLPAVVQNANDGLLVNGEPVTNAVDVSEIESGIEQTRE